MSSLDVHRKSRVSVTRERVGFPAGSVGAASACNAEGIRDTGSISRLGRSPGKEMATESSILAWKIPWTEETSGL